MAAKRRKRSLSGSPAEHVRTSKVRTRLAKSRLKAVKTLISAGDCETALDTLVMAAEHAGAAEGNILHSGRNAAPEIANLYESVFKTAKTLHAKCMVGGRALGGLRRRKKR